MTDYMGLDPLDMDVVSDSSGNDLFSMFFSDDQASSTSSPNSMASASPTGFQYDDPSSTWFGTDPMASELGAPLLQDGLYLPTPPVDSPAAEEKKGTDEATVKKEAKVDINEQSSSDRSSSSRKRNHTALENSVVLTREELRNMSSKALEEYAQKLAATRELTKGEERTLKRQRRLIKNRESAQLSRARKKMYIEELERKVNTISVHSEHMATQMAHLAAENKALKEEVYMLRSALKKQQQRQGDVKRDEETIQITSQMDASPSPVSSPDSVGSAVSPVQGKETGETAFSALGSDALPFFGKTNPLTASAQTAKVCLFVILLSFGIFFSATAIPRGPQYPTLEAREPIPEVLPQEYQRGYTGRTLKAVEETNVLETSNQMDVDSSYSATSSEANNGVGGDDGNSFAPLVVQDTTGTSHVVCPNAYKHGQAEGVSWKQAQPTFTLVLPPTALEGTVPNVDKVADGQLLEVACQILSLNVVPSVDSVVPLPLSEQRANSDAVVARV